MEKTFVSYLTHIVCKLMELIITSHLVKHIDNINILYENIYFRTELIEDLTTYDWLNSLISHFSGLWFDKVKADMKSYKQRETAATSFIYNRVLASVYVMVDVICIGLLEMQGTQSKREI